MALDHDLCGCRYPVVVYVSVHKCCCFQETWICIMILYYSPTLRYHRLFGFTLKDYKDIPIPYCHYHGSWWPGDTRNQGISIHDINPVYAQFPIANTGRFNIDWKLWGPRSGGYYFLCSVIFPIFPNDKNNGYLYDIKFIFGRCHRSWAAETPGKYEHDWNYLTYTFAKSKFPVTEKLVNEALVAPTPDLSVPHRISSCLLSPLPSVIR